MWESGGIVAQPDDQAKINSAIETYLGSSPSDEAVRAIAAAYGESTAATVRGIYDEAICSPVDWRTATMDTGLDAMHELLNERYPWLSRKARSNLNYAFTMAWK